MAATHTLTPSSVVLAQEEPATDDLAPEETAAEQTFPLIEEPREKRPNIWRTIGMGATGIFTAFLLHESGHILTNLAYRNVPTISRVTFAGFIPFFSIDPGIVCSSGGCVDGDGKRFKGGRSGKYLITSAGFLTQAVINEIILTHDPKIRYHYKPFQKGMLLFNTSLSFGYAIANWLRIEPPAGDIQGMSSASGLKGDLVALLVIIPAALDLYRYLHPEAKWVPWVSRVSKASLFGIAFTF